MPLSIVIVSLLGCARGFSMALQRKDCFVPMRHICCNCPMLHAGTGSSSGAARAGAQLQCAGGPAGLGRADCAHAPGRLAQSPQQLGRPHGVSICRVGLHCDSDMQGRQISAAPVHVALTIAHKVRQESCLAIPVLRRIEQMYAVSRCACLTKSTGFMLQGARQLVDVDARYNRLLLPDQVMARKGLQPRLARMDLRANAVAAHPQYRCCPAHVAWLCVLT